MNESEFLEAYKLLELNYNKKLPDEIIRLWYNKFKEVPKEVFKESIIDTIERDAIFPTMEIVNRRVEINGRRKF